jgi:FAD synthetase
MSQAIKERVEKYIKGMKDRLSKIPPEIINKHEKIFQLVSQYTEDAEIFSHVCL